MRRFPGVSGGLAVDINLANHEKPHAAIKLKERQIFVIVAASELALNMTYSAELEFKVIVSAIFL